MPDRRAMLLGAVALATGAGANAAAVVATRAAELNPDADLLALGEELKSPIVEWRTKRAKDARHREAWEAACEAAGMPDREFRLDAG